MWKKNLPGRSNQKGKHPQVGIHWSFMEWEEGQYDCSRNSHRRDWKLRPDAIWMPDGGHFSGHCKDFTLTVNTVRKHERFWSKGNSINLHVLNQHPSSVLRMD